MADKILNTRIQLKYDTIAKWQSGPYNGTDSTKWLKPGELAIVTLAPNKEAEVTNKANQHPLLFKVGTGAHKFDDLPWASALAADVYDWAKLEYSAFLTKLEENFYTETEINTLIANYSTTTQMNNAIKLETDRALAAEEALGKRIDAFNLPENGFASKDDFDALKGKVEGEDGALAKANSAYELAESKITEGEVNTKLADYATKTEAQGYANAKDEAITAAQNAANAAQDDVDALEGNVGSVDGLSTTSKNVVGAINEVFAAVGTGGTAAVVTVEKSTDGLTYTIKQGNVSVGTIDIPKDMVVTAGEVVSNPEGQAEGTYIKLTLANVADPLYINVGTLVDIYKAQANAAQVQITIDSATREISATIVAGSITATELADNAVITAKIADANVTKAKLSAEVQASLDKADSALQSHQDISGKADKVKDATEGNFAGLDASGNLTNSGKKAADFATAEQGERADRLVEAITVSEAIEGASVPGVKIEAAPPTGGAILNLSAEARLSAFGGVQLEGSRISLTTVGQATYNDKEIATVDQVGVTAITSKDSTPDSPKPDDNVSGLKVTSIANTNGVGTTVNVEIDDTVTFIFDCGGAND